MSHSLPRLHTGDDSYAVKRGCVRCQFFGHEILLRNSPICRCLPSAPETTIFRTLGSAPFQIHRPIGIDLERCCPVQCQWWVLSAAEYASRRWSANQRMSAASPPPSATLSWKLRMAGYTFCSNHSTASSGLRVSIVASSPAMTRVRLLTRLSASSGQPPSYSRSISRRLRTESAGQRPFNASASHRIEMPLCIQVVSRRSEFIFRYLDSSSHSERSRFQIEQPHLFLCLCLVLAQPVSVDCLCPLGGNPNLLRTPVADEPIHDFCCGGMRREVRAVQCVHYPNVAALKAAAHEEHRLVEVPRHAFARGTLPCPCQLDRRRKGEDLVLLRAPTALGKIAWRDAGAPQEFLHLVTRHLSRLVEKTEELASVWLSI